MKINKFISDHTTEEAQPFGAPLLLLFESAKLRSPIGD